MNTVAIKQENMPIAATPDYMIQLAIEKGADIDKLEKLLALKERWEASEARKAYVSAMNAFKANPPTITKNKQVFHNNKPMYKHATLDHVCDVIGKALSTVGISFQWKTQQDGGQVKVTCILTHELGHQETTSLTADPDKSGAKNSIQAVGSTVTYLQRYTLLSAVGLATEEQDDDGAGTAETEGLSEAVDTLIAAQTIEELQAAFKAAWNRFGDSGARAKITAAKDQRKREIARG